MYKLNRSVCERGTILYVYLCMRVWKGGGGHVIYNWTNAGLWGVLVEVVVVVGQNGAAPQMK